MGKDRRVQLLLTVFAQAFGGASWHGTPLAGALRGVSPRQALASTEVVVQQTA